MKGKILKYLIIAVVAANLAIVAVVFLGGASSTAKKKPLPNPNGYDYFVAAGQAVSINSSTYTNMGKEELATVISNNQKALKLISDGLGRESRVPNDYSAQYLSRITPQIESLRPAEVLLCAEGRLAELEGRTNDAAKTYIQGVRFGQECSRGGIIITRLIGMACEGLAEKSLEKLTNSLDAPGSRETAQALETIDAKAEPFADALAEEKSWSHTAFGLQGRIVEFFTYKKMVQPVLDKFTAKSKAAAVRRRQLMVAFAARAYELDKGKRPETPGDMAPGYLKAIPLDPTTGTNLVWKP